MDTIIKNGTIVTAGESYRADIGIEGGKIIALGEHLFDPSAKVIDADWKYIFPGAIDPHVHFQLPFCGTVSADDFENGTKAAACGGVTTVIDFAIQKKGESLMKAIEARRAEADGKVCVDYALHSVPTDWNEATKEEMKAVIDYGIPTFKMFMIYAKEGLISNDDALFEGLEVAAEYGGQIGVHAESVRVLDKLIERYHNEADMKKYGAYLHVLSRPNFIEAEAVQRAIKWSQVTGGRLYIVHLSTKEGAELVKRARHHGLNVYAETCPQYLLLDDEVFKRPNGHLFATCPQIKKKEDSEALWQGLAKGYLSNVATDTCTFDTKQKAMWEGDFTKIPFGLPGVETMLSLMYTFGVGGGRFSVNRLVALTSTNAAKLMGMFPRKGAITVGSDADLVIFDPNKDVTLTYKDLQTNCDWSPYEGMKLKGYPEVTLCRGKVIAGGGKFVGQTGYGRFVKREPV